MACDASTAIVAHAVRLPLGVEAQGWPEFRAICKGRPEAGLQRPFWGDLSDL